MIMRSAPPPDWSMAKSNKIQHYLTKKTKIQHNSTKFDVKFQIRQDSTKYNIIQQVSTLFNIIQH